MSEAEQFTDFVERLGCRVVQRAAQPPVLTKPTDVHEQGGPAPDHETHRRKDAGRFPEKRQKEVTFQVIDVEADAFTNGSNFLSPS